MSSAPIPTSEEKAPVTVQDSPRPASPSQDVAAEIVGEHAQEIDPELQRRVLRKIDWYLIPAMVLGYGLVYYDKVMIALPTSSSAPLPIPLRSRK